MTRRIELRGKHGKGFFAIVDDEDYEWLSQYKWYGKKSKNGKLYACTPIQKTIICMHSMILAVPKGLTGDHKNNDGLDNTRNNLRIATVSQNNANKKTSTSPSKTSVYKGVHKRNKASSFWIAKLTVNMKTIYIGSFATEDEAGKAYDKAATPYFGEFAYLNFPK